MELWRHVSFLSSGIMKWLLVLGKLVHSRSDIGTASLNKQHVAGWTRRFLHFTRTPSSWKFLNQGSSNTIIQKLIDVNSFNDEISNLILCRRPTSFPIMW